MRAKGRAMRVMRAMRATVKMLRIFICYIYIRMRTRTRATEQDNSDSLKSEAVKITRFTHHS